MNNIKLFNGKFVIALIAVCVATGFTASQFDQGMTQVETFASSHADDILNGNLGKQVLNH